MRVLMRGWLLFVMVVICSRAVVGAEPEWTVQYFYDQDDSKFVILDLAFSSPLRGVAVGYEMRDSSTRPMSVVTSDGGRTWSRVKVRRTGLSLFFLNESIGWMVTERGLFKTVESGRSWVRISKQKNILRVAFRDERNGWAVGREKSIWTTQDGGVTWEPLPAAAKPSTTPAYTNYTWIDYVAPARITIVGYSQRPRRRASMFPDWMDPERLSRRRQVPTSSLVVQTADGGQTWKSSVTSMFGRIVRIRMKPDGTGVALVRFESSFEWPSEVYRIEADKTERIFREKDRSITDIVLTGAGRVYLAGYKPSGTLKDLPIPGELKMLYSDDLVHWAEMKVDYRAEGRRVVLAYAGADNLWAATDTGMILKLAAGD